MLYANSSDSIIIRRKDWELDISLRQKIDIGAKSTSGGHAIDFAAKAGLKFGYVAVKIFDGNALTPHTEDFSMFSFPIAPNALECWVGFCTISYFCFDKCGVDEFCGERGPI